MGSHHDLELRHCEERWCAKKGTAGRILVLGGMDATRTRLRSVEALDPREGRWQELPPMAQARASTGVAAIGDQLFVVAGVALVSLVL